MKAHSAKYSSLCKSAFVLMVSWMWVQAAGMGQEQLGVPSLPGPLPADPGQVCPGHPEGPSTHAQLPGAAQGPHP